MYALDARRDALRVRRATVRGAPDGLRARQCLEAALSEVASSGIGLPPQALLVVRRVVPAGRLQSGPAGGARKFGQTVRSDLERIARLARRPWRDVEVAGADAVVFADDAELAACLVRDWLGGRVADRWWWQSVLGDLSPREWLRRHVLARGELTVPVIAVLAASPDAAAWLARLEDAEAEEAIAVIARTHALSLTVAEDEPTAPRRRVRSDRHEFAGIESGRRADSRAAALERLVATVPEVHTPALRPPQRRLLALALALTRAPSWARTPQLAFALRGLDGAGLAADEQALATPDAGQPEIPRLRDPRAATVTGAPPMGDTPPQRVGSPGATDGVGAPPPEPEESRAVAQRVGSPGATDGVGAAPPGPGESRALAQRRADVAYFGTRDAPHASTVARISALQNAPPTVTQTVEVEVPATQPETPTAAPIPRAEPEEAPSFEDASRVRTQFGGIFYLLNAALAMGLYGDFTAPRASNLELSPWDWLALVGRAWFGDELVGDAVWKGLAELAGRNPGDEPDRDFHPPSEDWLPEHLGILRARLALALGAEEGVDVPAFVCRYAAGIEISASAVRVHLALCDLPLAIRIAGLDRDPGWIPAAGRSVAFHFA